MADDTAPAGKVTGHVTIHPVDERPAIWVINAAGRWAGREHARAEQGRAVLAAWSEAGLGQYRWIRATDTEPRDSEP